jgi:ubiquinone/menaquinone biosynthesis C-methylase UbiE
MNYCDLRPAVAAYESGHNVMESLRDLLGETKNNASIIEISYDLQAGSYWNLVRETQDHWKAYGSELATILRQVALPSMSILDVGTGEMSTLAAVANAGLPADTYLHACDISLSRIKVGLDTIGSFVPSDTLNRLHAFVGNLFQLPYLDSSIDIVWTSHALEPNGGREVEAVTELMRVARRHVVMFEPSYENNTLEGRMRMDRHGYIRNLPDAIEKAGGKLIDVVPITAVSNPLNPTYAYVCEKSQIGSIAVVGQEPWACPATRLPMKRLSDCFFSPMSHLAYPIVADVPILRAEQAVLATVLR